MTAAEIDKAVTDARKLLARLEGIQAGGTLPEGARLLGVKEVAETLGIGQKTVSGYVSRGQAPEPYARLASGPVWTEGQVDAWKVVRRNDDA